MKIRFTNRTTLPMAVLLSRLSWHFGPNGVAFAQLQEDTYAGVQDLILHVTFIIKVPHMGLLEITAGAFGANTEERTAPAVTKEWEGPDRLEQLAFSFAFADKGKHPEEDRNDPIPAASAKVGDIVVFKTPSGFSPLYQIRAVVKEIGGSYSYRCAPYDPVTGEPRDWRRPTWKESDLSIVYDRKQIDACRELFNQLRRLVIDRRVPEATVINDSVGINANSKFLPEGFFTVRVPFLFTQIMKE